MTDFATLGIRADTRDLRTAQDELRGLTSTGAATERAISGNTDKITAGWRRMASVAGAAAGAVAAAFSIRAMVNAADTWTDLTARVRLAIPAHEDASDTMDRLSDMARRTYSSLGLTAEGWLSNATALRELGMTTAQSLDFQEAMNNALVVSGARAERAASVQNALSQAMALGVLRGDQLNSVIQNGGRVAELLAEEMGTTVSGLRAVGAEGKITGDVIQRALLGNLERLREEADSMPATIGDAMTLLGNSFLVLVASFDGATGASSAFASAIIAVGDTITGFAGGIEAASNFIGGFQGYIIAAAVAVTGMYIPAIYGAVVATGAWIASLITLRGAMIATGIGAFIVIAGMLINWLIKLVENTGSWGNALSLLGEVASGVWEGIKTSAQAIGPAIQAVWYGIEATFLSVIGNLANKWGEFLAMIGSGLRMVAPLMPAGVSQLAQVAATAMQAAGGMGNDMLAASRSARSLERSAMATASERMTTGFDQAAEAAGRLVDAVRGVGEFAVDVEGAETAVTRLNGALGGGAGKANPFTEALKSLAAEMQELQLVAQEYNAIADSGMNVVNMAAYAETRVSLLNAAMTAGIPITAELRDRIHELALGYSEATHAADEARARLEDMQASSQRGADAITNVFMALGKGSDAAKQAIAQLLMEMARVQMMRAVIGLGGTGGGGTLLSLLGGLLTGGMGGGIPKYATGTNYHPGGLARINEIGGEIVNLPTGAQVIPHDISKEMARGGGGAPVVNFHVDARGAQMGVAEQIRRELHRATPQIVTQSVQATHESFREFKPG